MRSSRWTACSATTASTCGTASPTGCRTRSAPRPEILVAMDWTDLDHDDQATLVLSLVTGHGRAAPLLWLSVWKDELKNQCNAFEDNGLRRLAELVPAGCRVTILADRSFGDQKLFAYLAPLGFGYVIRFRGNIHVTAVDGTTRHACSLATPMPARAMASCAALRLNTPRPQPSAWI